MATAACCSAQATVLLGSEAAAGQRPRTKAVRLREPAGADDGPASPRAGREPLDAPRPSGGRRMSHGSARGGAGASRTRKLDAAALAPVVRDVLGFPLPDDDRAAGRAGVDRAARRRGSPRRRARRGRSIRATASSTPTGARSRTRCARSAGQIDHPPDAVAFARNEDDVEAVLEWAAARGRRGDPVRRRDERRRRRRAARAERPARRGLARPVAAGPSCRSRCGLARGAHPGRRRGAGAGGAARASTG